ncbi:MAG: RNA polymerase sigma factor [Armatimonadota bacterium]
MTATETDGELLRRLARGDVQALGGLYDRHARRVYHLLLAHGLDEHEAQDVLQEVFLALMERGRALRRVDNALAYLLGIARHQAARQRRWRDRHPATAQTEEATQPQTAETLAAVDAVRQLPPEQAEVVALKVWHEMTLAEIAAALGISPNTAASRYRYGIEKLRALWRAEA